jgi:hypothetical protein
VDGRIITDPEHAEPKVIPETKYAIDVLPNPRWSGFGRSEPARPVERRKALAPL